MTVGCSDGKGGMEWVGIAASRDWMNHDTALHKFGDSLRLQVEYSIPDDTKPDKIGGGWEGLTRNTNVFHHVAPQGKPYSPGMPLMPATIGGPQVESYFVIQLFDEKWWLGYNGFWLGYYEASLFSKNGMGTKGCEVSWYGEVYDHTPMSWTSTDMGSGRFASEGVGNAAYFRDPFYTDLSGESHWPDVSKYVTPFNDSCYTRSPLYSGVSPWDRWFFLGGPGSKAPNCK